MIVYGGLVLSAFGGPPFLYQLDYLETGNNDEDIDKVIQSDLECYDDNH